MHYASYSIDIEVLEMVEQPLEFGSSEVRTEIEIDNLLLFISDLARKL